MGTVIPPQLTDILRLQSLASCASYNEELRHWNTALVLRESYYFINTPFVIPEVTELPEEPTYIQPTKKAAPQPLPSPVHQISERRTPDCQERTPTTYQPVSPLDWVQLFDVSHVGRLVQPKPPVKLRHPAKVHKRDLTVNTLKIYVKHYMDNQAYADDDYIALGPSAGISDVPTSRRRTSADPLMPRPAFENRAVVVSPPKLIQKPRKRRKIDPEIGICGITMSYLRRVTELQLLAGRIVAAEDKKKRQEARRVREVAKSQGLPVPPKVEVLKSQASTRERTKRLFRQAIIKLCDEGSIVLWDGPCRVWDADRGSHSSRLWHTNVTVDTTVSSTGVSTAGGNLYREDPQDHEMSEPDPREESYVSLTSAHLGKYVEKAIKEICSRKEKGRGSGPKGPTLTEILSRLKADGRWRSIGECAVAEALQWLKDEERVWEVGGGRWELTI